MSTITYVSTAEDERSATRLAITPDGIGHLEIGSNRERVGKPVGRFEAAVPPALLQQLWIAVSSAEYSSAKSQSALTPGEGYREIRLIGSNGAELSKVVGERIEPPAPFVKAETAVEGIITQLQQQPVLAATLVVAGLPVRVPAGTPTAVDLTLRNTGKTPFWIEAPEIWGKAQTVCALRAVRTDVPAQEMSIRHQQFVDFGPTNFQAASKKADGGVLALAPGEAVALRFREDFAWPPGPYRVDLMLSLSFLDERGKPLFTGNLVSGGHSAEVTR